MGVEQKRVCDVDVDRADRLIAVECTVEDPEWCGYVWKLPSGKIAHNAFAARPCMGETDDDQQRWCEKYAHAWGYHAGEVVPAKLVAAQGVDGNE